jgi:hypothetical protein
MGVAPREKGFLRNPLESKALGSSRHQIRDQCVKAQHLIARVTEKTKAPVGGRPIQVL